MAVANLLADRGTALDLEAARATAVAFDAMTRPSETLSVRARDVTALGGRKRSLLAYPGVSVRIAPPSADLGFGPSQATKAGMYDGTTILGDAASRAAHRGWVSELVSLLAASRPLDGHLFGITLAQWDACFASACRELQLTPLRASPHCLRHGSASTDFALGLRSLAQVQRR